MVEINKSTTKFKAVLDGHGSRVILPDGREFYYLPFWFEKKGTFKFEPHHLDRLPKDLVDYIQSLREDSNFTIGKKQLMKKRFKTKQELNNPKVEFKWGEPCKYPGGYYPGALTTDPHPYEGKDFLVKTYGQPDNVLSQVQQKLFALGYHWRRSGNTERKDIWPTDLLVKEGNLFHNPSPEDYEDSMCLTPQQFLEGYLPVDPKLAWQDEVLAADEPCVPKKPDAYIVTIGGKSELRFWDALDEIVLTGEVDEAYQFDLMSEEAFKDKHPEKLKFKEWDVKPRNASVRIGCEAFRKENLKIFSKLMQTLNKHNVDAKEFYVFLYTNKETLGI